MADKELVFSSAWELRRLIAAKQVSPVELTELFLSRIKELNPKLNAYLTVTSEEAMASARAAEQAVVKGDSLGPLHGIPVSLKDLDLTKGIRTTLGSLFLRIPYRTRTPYQWSERASQEPSFLARPTPPSLGFPAPRRTAWVMPVGIPGTRSGQRAAPA